MFTLVSLIISQEWSYLRCCVEMLHCICGHYVTIKEQNVHVTSGEAHKYWVKYELAHSRALLNSFLGYFMISGSACIYNKLSLNQLRV